MADNKTLQWRKSMSGSKGSADSQTHCGNDYYFSTINTYVAQNIPAYSQINSATIVAEATKNPKGSANAGTLKLWITNGSAESGSIELDNLGTSKCTYSGTEKTKTVNLLSLGYVKNKTSNSGCIECSGKTNFAVYMYFMYLLNQNFTSTIDINWSYNEPRAIVSVSKSGEGTVTGAGTYHWGNSYTITAKAATGWKFVKWSDGDTNASRTFTVNSSLIKDYETSKSYQAIFEKLTYTVTWKNADGTVLETDTGVAYGTTPTYNGATPTKSSTAQHTYTFSGWSPAISTVTGNVTYTAQFTATVRKYTVKWYNYDGTLLETDADVPYGTKPTYNGTTPTKPSDDYYNYGFAGWSPSITEGIQGDKNFTAQFAQTDRYYTVRWVNASAVQGAEGTLLETDEVKFNTQPDYNGATPKHPKQDTDPALNYDFIGWSAKVTDPAKPDTELEKVKGDITYTAIYETTPKLYPITVILFDSQSTDIYEYGTEITIEAPNVVGYKFIKWTDGDTRQSRPVTVTGEATYQAIYERVSIPIKVNLEQVVGCYIVPTTQTIVYVISGTVPTVKSNDNTVDGWSFLVLNEIPENGYQLEKLFITDNSGATARAY